MIEALNPETGEMAMIEVKLLRASPGYARLGFDAPAAVRVRRKELAPFVGEAAEARNG